MKPLSFSTLGLDQAVLNNLDHLGYQSMTPIQQETLPHSLKGKDIIGKAKTGSGKTASFALPMLLNIDPRSFKVQSLVLCPTRELATQVTNEIRKLARFQQNVKVLTLCGGSPFGPQKGSLERGAHIVVGTPGRIKDHLRKENLNLDHAHTLVLDEADRMLDMGFLDDVEWITSFLPENRQTMLFSATFPNQLDSLSNRLLRNAFIAEVSDTESAPDIEQFFYKVEKSEREDSLMSILANHQPSHAVIFCHTKQGVVDLSNRLRHQGHSVLPIQGDMDQKQRDQTLIRFSNHSVTLLIATDVAARGLDIDSIDTVINYELPRDSAVYTHRIGRTGRAGKKGTAINLYTSSEQYKLDDIQKQHSADNIRFKTTSDINFDNHTTPSKPPMVTINIDAGKKAKIRPGDLVGALTSNTQLTGDDLGKIAIMPFASYVAVKRELSHKALNALVNGKVKGKSVKAKLMS